MSKNQKKPAILSMGGVVPRKHSFKTIENVLKPAQINLSPKKTGTVEPVPSVQKTKKTKKRSFKLSRVLIYLRSNILYLLVPAFVAGLYLFDINKFPPLLSTASVIEYNSSSDIDSLAYLPVKVALIALNKLHIGGEANIRYLSVATMLFALFCFYKFISTWVSKRMSLLALLMFSCSSWALFQAKQDNITTMMIALVPAILYLGGLVLYSNSKIIKIISALVLAQFIFVPGAIWFFLIPSVLSLSYSEGKIRLKSLLLPLLVFFIAIGGYLGLIVHWSLISYHQLTRLLGLEVGSLPSLNAIKINITELPGQLFYSGLNDSSMWLKSTPVIDWVSAVFVAAGLICLYKSKLRPVRKRIVSLFLILGLLLVFLNGATYISLVLPLIYITVALGVTYLADQWMVIFPNNPLARGFGFILVLLVVFAACTFHLERYFIGWPKTEEYHQIYKD